MESIEANIGTFKRSLYDGIILYSVYYMLFDGYPDDNDVILTYVQEIKYQNTEAFYESCVEDLENYIGTHIMLPGKYSIPVLKDNIGRKRYHYSNLVGYPNNNPILDTIIYDLDFPDSHVE